MKGIKQLFNWVAENLDPYNLFPKEWELSKDEQYHLMVKGYKVDTVKRPAVIHPYCPVHVFYDCQIVKTNDDQHLKRAGVEKVQAILDKYRAQANPDNNPSSKPE